MKIFNLFTAVLVITVFFTIPIMAQTDKEATTNKIAKVNIEAFKDGKSGIKDLAIAYDKLETEFKPQIDELKILYAKLEELHKEILQYAEISKKDWTGHSNVSSKANAKLEEYNKLGGEYEIKQKDYRSLLEKREAEIIKPIMDKIRKALEQFKTKKGYALILDMTKIENDSFIIAKDNTPDITADFISFYNVLSEKEIAQ